MGCYSCNGKSAKKYSNLSPEPPYIHPFGGRYPGSLPDRPPEYSHGFESRYRPHHFRLSESRVGQAPPVRNRAYRSFLARFAEKEAESRDRYPLTMAAIDSAITRTARLYAHHTRRRPRFPDAVYLTDDLPPGVGGREEEFYLGSRTFRTISINQRYTRTPEARGIAAKITEHETIHAGQKGKNPLDKIRYSINGADLPIGRMLIEGGAELELDKIGLGRTGAYPSYYRLARAVDRAAPLRDLFLAAQSEGEDGAVRFLNQPAVRAAIDRYQQAANPSKN